MTEAEDRSPGAPRPWAFLVENAPCLQEQLLIGIIIAASCLSGLWFEAWILAATRKGGWLV